MYVVHEDYNVNGVYFIWMMTTRSDHVIYWFYNTCKSSSSSSSLTSTRLIVFISATNFFSQLIAAYQQYPSEESYQNLKQFLEQ